MLHPLTLKIIIDVGGGRSSRRFDGIKDTCTPEVHTVDVGSKAFGISQSDGVASRLQGDVGGGTSPSVVPRAGIQALERVYQLAVHIEFHVAGFAAGVCH